MSGKFIADLAIQNLRRNRRALLPYALSCIGTVMMFFILFTLATTTTLEGVYGGRSMRRTLQLGVWVMLLFSLVFLFYTRSFLVKRRKKEFGVFNMLGLEKRHIARMLLVETFFVGILTTLAGMGLGALLSKLMYLLILNMLGAREIVSFVIPRAAFSLSAAAFLGIHGLTLLSTIRQVHTARPVELLKGGSMGEREPKARLWLALIGLGCLGTGYWMSLRVRDALAAIPQFLWAVLLVIVGTYLLFTAGTVSMLKLLQKNKRFYYQPRHFSVVAGMRHRMNRNAMGLATICILSTMVLVMASATASLFTAREDLLTERFPRQTMLSVTPVEPEEMSWFDQAALEAARQVGAQATDAVNYRSVNFSITLSPDSRELTESEAGRMWQPGVPMAGAQLISLDDYNAVTGAALTLAPGEAVYFTHDGVSLPESITLCGQPLRLRQRLASLAPMDILPHIIYHNYFFILTQEQLIAIADTLKGYDNMWSADKTWHYTYHQAFNTGSLSPQTGEEMLAKWRKMVQEYLNNRNSGGYSTTSHQLDADRADFNALYGGLLFVAIFLGSMFIMAMVLIIYYKQVSEGYEDKGRFLVLQQVGMSAQEVRQSIKSQVLMVFFLPLLMAGLHLIAAFNIVWRVLQVMSMSNLRLFMLVCLLTYLVFAVFYLLVYRKTAGSYYRIVKAGAARERSLP